MKVNPADLRFTQDTIAPHFKAPHEHFSVREALEQIRAGKMSPDTFPRLRVFSSSGYWWSIDNRRLWVFRMANCSEITVKIMNTPHLRLDGVINVPSRLRRLSKADFLPKVRGGQIVAAARAAPKDLHPRVAEVMARYGLSGQIRGSIRGSKNVLPLANAAPSDRISRVEGFNVSGSERQSGRLVFGALEQTESRAKGARFVAAHIEMPPESTNTKKNPNSSLSSFPDESNGRHLGVCAAKVSKETNVGIECSDRPNIGTDVSERSVPRESTCISKETNVGIECSDRPNIGTEVSERSVAQESTCSADFRLLVPAPTGDNHGLERHPNHDLAPNSWFGRVADLIFGCFGCA